MSKVAHSIKDKARTDDVQITESVDFGSLLLSDNVLNGLKNSGFVRPSPIQLKAIPLGRCGLDLIVQAKSGTGKTCVFSVIALESIVTDTASTQVLVLAPTREIAVQIWEVINSIGSATKQLECHTFIGGLPLHEDRIKLKKCHIAVGTPGRIKQLIEGGVLRTDSLRLFILDEADKLLEESFQEQINWIYSTLPENKQMLALSATYPEYLADHLTAYMRNPTFLRLNISDPALLGIRQYYKTVAYHPLSHVVFEEKSKELINILSSVSFQQCLVFSNLQTRAQTLADSLTKQGWPTACIAGCLDQKDRNHAMAKLKTYKCRILISTDLTSRGIDADKVNMVINLDIPKDHETYLHRIGRAGRFGSFGIAVTLVSDGQEKMKLDTIEKQCNTQIFPLPDPLPSDLAKPGSPIFLDDVVSSEVINTDKSSSNQSSPIKLKPTTPAKSSSLDTDSDKDNKNKPREIKSTGDDSSSEGDKSKDNLELKKHVLPELEAKEHLFDGLKRENADTTVTKSDENKDQNNVNRLDRDQNNADRLDRDQESDGRTPVSYEDLEYIEMTETLQVNMKAEFDSKTRNSTDTEAGEKIKKSYSLNKKSDKDEEKIKEKRPFLKSKRNKSSNSLTTGNSTNKQSAKDEVKLQGKKPFLNSRRNKSDSSLKTESLKNDEVETVNETESSSSHSKMTLKTNVSNAVATTESKSVPSNEIGNFHSLNGSKLSASSFEKVNISNVFKNSTGFKPLSKSHSYKAARESLKMFREKHDTDTETVDKRDNCSVPVIRNDMAECETLLHAINQVQDLLENRLHMRTPDTNTVETVEVKYEKVNTIETVEVKCEKVNIVETPEVKCEKVSEVQSISSEDEFEAKEEMLNNNSSFTSAIQVEDASKSAEFRKSESVEPQEKEMERPKKIVKKNIQKPRKQRFGYQGNFAIGHLLQQERDQELESDISNDGPGKASSIIPDKVETIKVESIRYRLQNIPDEAAAENFESPPDKFIGSINTSDEKSPREQNLAGLVNVTITSSRNKETPSSTFSLRKEPDKVSEGFMREDIVGINIERNLETHSNSVSSTTDSESTDREIDAIPEAYRRIRKPPEIRSRGADRARSSRDHARSDSRSEDSGVYSRTSYQEQWRRWYKQYEDWHKQNMNMWGYPGTFGNSEHDLAGKMGGQGYGFPGWQDPSQPMYYPYQNYHSYYHQNYHPSYHQNYPYDYSMYPRHSHLYQNQNSLKLNEQMTDAFQFQEEYIKEMSKCRKK